MNGAMKVRFTFALMTGVAAIALAPPAVAQLSGLSVAVGQASLAQTAPGASVIRQTTEKALLNWQSFSIASGNSVQFMQPNAAAIALNRVTGGSASAINGSLSANGQVWIVNPNGVLFGPGASVNVAGLLATTADIRDQDFVAGNYAFGIPSANANAGVVNLGTIRIADGGSAVLAAPHAENQGLIEARYGSVVLGGTSTFTVDFQGDKLISFQVPQPSGSGSQVINGGTISAAGGTVVLTARAARNVLTNVINTTGMISATTASMVNGEIVLDAGTNGAATVSGTLDASGKAPGQTGGTVEVLGASVSLTATARINAAGAAGGGTVSIGGSLHGTGPLPDAQNASVAAGASISVDAVSSGNGGTVALWSNDTTIFNGSISAQGGALGGNGGFVETSGANNLSIATGSVNALAPQGQAGTWLLDPRNITVQNGGNATLSQVSSYDTDSRSTDTIAPSTIANAQANVVLQAIGDITFNNTISMANNGVGITASAGDDITINAAITTRGGALAFNTGTGPSPSGDGGSITIAAAISTTGGGQTGGSITLNSPLIALGGNLTTAGGVITSNGNTILQGVNSVTPTGWTIDTTNSGATSAGANIDLNARVGSEFTQRENLTVKAGTSGDVYFAHLSSKSGKLDNLTIDGARNVTANGSRGVTVGSFTELNGHGNLTVAQSLTTGGGTTSGASLDGGAIDINTTGAVNIGAGLPAPTSGGSFTFSVLSAGADAGAPNSTLFAAGTATGDGGAITINAGSITLANGASSRGGGTDRSGLTGGDAGAISLTATGAIAIGSGHGTPLEAAGGASLASSGTGHGGNAATIAVSGQSVSVDRVVATGGDVKSTSGSAGQGADISLTATAGTLTVYGLGSTTSESSISARGGEKGVATPGPFGLVDNFSNGTITNSAGDVTLTGTVKLATSTHGANPGSNVLVNADGNDAAHSGVITINGSVDATTTNTESLALAALGGAQISGNLGSAKALNSVTLPSSGNGGAVDFAGAVKVGTAFKDQRTSGALEIDGLLTAPSFAMTAGSTSLALEGGALFAGGVSFSGGPFTLGGTFTFTGAGTKPNFANAVTLSAPTVIDSSAVNGAVTFASTVDGTSLGNESLSVKSGTGAVAFDNSVTLGNSLSVSGGSVTVAGALTTNAGGIAITSSGTIGVTKAILAIGGDVLLDASRGAAVDVTNASVRAESNSHDATNTGTVSINGAVDLSAASVTAGSGRTVALSGPDSTITISGSIIDAGDVIFAPGLGFDVLFSTNAHLMVNAAGGQAGNVSIYDARNVTMNSGSSIQADGGLTLGGSNGPITGNVVLNTITLDHNGDGNGHNGTVGLTASNIGGSLTLNGIVSSTSLQFAGLSLTAAGGIIDNAPINLASGGVTFNSPVTLGTAITTAGGAVIVGATATLGSDATIATHGGAIQFTSTIDGTNAGGQSLTLDATSGGVVTLGGAIGGAVTLANLSITSDGALALPATKLAGDLTATAPGITQSGALVIAGNTLLAAGAGDIVLGNTGNDFNTVTVTNAGNVTLADANALSLGSVNATSLLVTAGGPITLTADITTNGDVSFNGAVVLAGDIDVLAGNHNISFASTIDATTDGGQSLNLDPVTGGQVILSGAIGGTHPLDNLSIEAGAAITLPATALTGDLTVTAPGIAQSGALLIGGNTLLAAGAGDIALGNVGNDFNTVTVSNGGNVTLADKNALSLGAIAATSLLVNASGAVTLTENITTNGAITLNPAVILADDVTLTSGGNAIAFGSTIDAPQALTLVAGAGAITVAGAVSDLSALTIVSSGSTIFSAAVGIDGGVNLAAAAGDVSFLKGLATGAASSFLNTGKLQIGSGPTDTSTVFGALTHTAGATTLGGSITTSGGQTYGATTLAAATTLTENGTTGIAFTSTLGGGAFALTLADAHGTATFTGAVSGLGALDTSAVQLARFNGTVAGASAKFGAVTFAGGGITTTGNQNYTGAISTLSATTLSATGTSAAITISGASALNNAFAFNVLAGGNIALNASLQQAGSGNVTFIAGWDGVTAANQAASHAGAFGLHSGNVTIGAGATGNVAVGSAGGLTTVAAANLTLSNANGYAQLGFHGPATGGITVNLTGGLTLTGGAATGAAAQIGHGGTQVAGNFSGDINVTAAGNIALTGGSGSQAYVQVGHGGAQSNEGATAGFGETGNITVHGNAIALNGTGNNASYAQIGNGGFEAGLNAQISSGSIVYSGNITVAAAGMLSLTAGGSNAYAQIGNGGDQVNVDAHLIGAGSTINLGGQITVSSGTSASQGAVTLSADDYAQIGNGGWSANTGATASSIQETGDINVTVTNSGPSAMNAGNKSIGYVQVGNGDATQTGFGNVSGNVFMTMSSPTFNDGTANAPITMGGATAPPFTVTGSAFLNGQLFGVVAPPPPDVPPPVITPPPPPPVEPPPVVVTPPPVEPPPVVVVEAPPPPPSSGPGVPNNSLAEFLNANAIGTSGLNSLLLASLSFTETTPISGTSTSATGQVNDSTASLLNAIQPGAGADTGGIGQLEALTERTGGAGASAFGPGGQATDTVTSSITQSLGGTPGVINAARTSANQTMIAGMLYEGASPVASRYTPRAIPSVDEVYSSWGNEAFWQ